MRIQIAIFCLMLAVSCKNTTRMNNHFSAYPRVRQAYAEKIEIIQSLLSDKNIDTSSLHLFIRAFKSGQSLEVWGKNTSDDKYQLLNTYEICKSSGGLGPKRKEGDRQVPEGFYFIDRFNPKSSYHLSLGLNYPNASDKILGDPKAPGTHIFIHGDCKSVGCLAMTDDKIKEIYLLAEFAKRAGQDKIPVHIFPFEMTDENIQKGNNTYRDFWRDLKEGYDYFENNQQVPAIRVNEKGRYVG